MHHGGNAMNEIISKIVTYIFIIVIFSFIVNIIRLIYSDIHDMNRKADAVAIRAGHYLKLLNLKAELYFDVEESYVLAKDQTIGRSEDNKIAIADPFLSNRNTRVFEEEGNYYLEDLGGKNGTLLNGKTLRTGIQELSDGDQIRVGQVRFLYVAEGAGTEPDDRDEDEDCDEYDDDDEDSDDYDDEDDDDDEYGESMTSKGRKKTR